MRTTDDAQQRQEALQALFEAETGLIHSNSQVGVAVLGLLLAYLPLSAAMVAKNEVPAFLVPWLALPVLFLLAFQTVLTAQSIRRTESARLIEQRLVQLAGLEDEYRQGKIGNAASDDIIEAGHIAHHRGTAWLTRLIAATMPHVGMYLLCMAYNAYILWEANRQLPDYPGRWGLVIGIAVSAIGWTTLFDAMAVHLSGRPAPVAIMVTAASGVLLQFAQTEDHNFPLGYVSVIGALMCVIGAFVAAITPSVTWVRALYRSAALTVYWAALVFWVAVVPFWGRVGDSELLIAAGFVLHLVLPLLLLAEVFVKRGTSYGTDRLGWQVFVVPTFYLTLVTFGTLGLGWPAPYPFLDWRGAPLQAAALCVVSGLAIAGLDVAVRRLDRAV